MRLFRAMMVGLVTFVTSCGDEPTRPIGIAPLEFSARISKVSLAVGDTATLEFVVRNPTSNTIRWDTSCGVIQKYIFVGSATQPLISTPQACILMATFTDLAPGAEYIERIAIRGATRRESAIYSPISLEVGRYQAHATIAGTPSNSVEFEVVQ